MSFLSIGILIFFLIEVYYIGRLIFDIRRMDKQIPLMIDLKERNQKLQGEIEVLKKSVEDAQKESDGINFLWNRTIKENSQLRKDLEVAEKQLRYLAQKVVSEEPQELRQEPVFWKTDSKEVQNNAIHEMTMV